MNFHPNLGSGGLSAVAVKVAAVPTVRVVGPVRAVIPDGQSGVRFLRKVAPSNGQPYLLK